MQRILTTVLKVVLFQGRYSNQFQKACTCKVCSLQLTDILKYVIKIILSWACQSVSKAVCHGLQQKRDCICLQHGQVGVHTNLSGCSIIQCPQFLKNDLKKMFPRMLRLSFATSQLFLYDDLLGWMGTCKLEDLVTFHCKVVR